MKKKHAHRCLCCYHTWYTFKPDPQALCPRCNASTYDQYVYAPHFYQDRRLVIEVIFSLTLIILLLLVVILVLFFSRC